MNKEGYMALITYAYLDEQEAEGKRTRDEAARRTEITLNPQLRDQTCELMGFLAQIAGRVDSEAFDLLSWCWFMGVATKSGLKVPISNPREWWYSDSR